MAHPAMQAISDNPNVLRRISMASQKVTIDLVLIPYYGDEAHRESAPAYLLRVD